MDRFKKSQILKLFLIITLLSITPMIPESLRPPYLYFVVNLLIIALGAEAGLLSFIFKAAEEKKVGPTAAQKPLIPSVEAPGEFEESAKKADNAVVEPEPVEKKPKAVEKSHSEKIVSTSIKVNRVVKKCPSTPSLFFIGGGDNEAEEFVEDDNEQEDIGDLTGQELFHKAETFIGNFYKQLKMQREESWKKIHGLYQKAF